MPSQEELKEFWEKCGFKHPNIEKAPWLVPLGENPNELWVYPDDLNYARIDPPELTLDNLFKYAVPKLIPKGSQGGVEFRFYPGGTSCILTLEDETGFNEAEYFLDGSNNPAIALYQAIKEVFDGQS